MIIIIEIIIELIIAPRFLLSSIIGFILFYIASTMFDGSDLATTVGMVTALIFMVLGAIWQFRSDSDSK